MRSDIRIAKSNDENHDLLMWFINNIVIKFYVLGRITRHIRLMSAVSLKYRAIIIDHILASIVLCNCN